MENGRSTDSVNGNNLEGVRMRDYPETRIFVRAIENSLATAAKRKLNYTALRYSLDFSVNDWFEGEANEIIPGITHLVVERYGYNIVFINPEFGGNVENSDPVQVNFAILLEKFALRQ